MAISVQILQVFNEMVDEVLQQNIAWDETWIYYDTPGTEQQVYNGNVQILHTR